MQKYLVKNLDCANCATKIETALSRTPGVNWASLDFGSLTLHIDTDDSVHALDTVRKVNPRVELEPITTISDRTAAASGFDHRRELFFLGASATLFAIVLFLDYSSAVTVPKALFTAVAAIAYALAGWSVFASALRTIRSRTFFDENVLMIIATLGAIGIGAYSEAVGVMIFYRTGEFFQDLAVNRSRRSIWSLLAQKPDHANVKTGSGLKRVPPEAVRVGDKILVRPGEKIPLDGDVIEGESQVDRSVLTGESVPNRVGIGESVMAGEVNMTGVITVEVTRPFARSSIARMLEMVENASARKAATEKFITIFARYYTPAVVAAAAAVAFIPPLVIPSATFQDWIYRALVLLVVSCPCALVISIPLGYFGGIGRASRNGILVKGSNAIDSLARLNTVVFDKTGTLTEGVFQVISVAASNGYPPDRILEFAATAEQHSNHPIARSIVAAYAGKENAIDLATPNGYTEVSGRGIRADLNGIKVLVGNDRFMHDERIPHGGCAIEGTVAHVAVNGAYAGHILIGDRIRSDAPEAIAALRKNGVERIIMLTGDNQCAADSIAARLDLDAHYAGLLPEDKVSVFEQLQSENRNGGRIAFVGDGINDAPVIARADVGVAMGAIGSDAAIETADVVLMTDSPLKMAEAVAISRQTRTIVWQNIVLALSVKGIVILLGAAGLAGMWAAVFADVGTALMAVINSTRALGKKGRPTAVEKKPLFPAQSTFPDY